MLIWYNHLIAAAGTQLHHVPLPFLLHQVVSYPTVCTNKNSRGGYYDMHTSTGVDLGIKYGGVLERKMCKQVSETNFCLIISIHEANRQSLVI